MTQNTVFENPQAEQFARTVTRHAQREVGTIPGHMLGHRGTPSHTNSSQDKGMPCLYEIGDDGEATGVVKPFCSESCRQKALSTTTGNWSLGTSGLNSFGYTPQCECCGCSITEVKELTPLQIELSLKLRTPKPSDIDQLYQARNRLVDELKSKGSVSLTDLAKLDRLGRFRIADECWAICSMPVRLALLDDVHHQVRSAALIKSTGH